MTGDGRAHQVQAHDMLVQIGAEVAGDRLGDLRGGEANAAQAERMGAERRDGDAARLLAAEERLDLSIPVHAIGEASPAGALARAEDRADQRENAGRLHQQPVLLLLEPPAVEFRELAFEIIADQGDGQIAAALHDPDAENVQRLLQRPRAADPEGFDLNGDFLQIFRGDVGRQAETRPVGRRNAIGCVHRDDEAAIEQSLERLVYCVDGKLCGERLAYGVGVLSRADPLGQRAIERATKEKLSVLRIETDSVRRQDIDRKIGRESKDVA